MKKTVFLNKNPSGKLSTVVMGVCQIVDGLVRILSLGYLSTRLPLDYASFSIKRHFEKLRREAK